MLIAPVPKAVAVSRRLVGFPPLDSGTLLVHVENPSWRREVEGAFPVILPRLTPLLGAGALRRLTIASEQE